MSDSDTSDFSPPSNGFTLGRVVRLVGLAAFFPLLIYLRRHLFSATPPFPAWIGVGVIGGLFAFMGVMDIRTDTAWASYSLVSRSEKPGLYWMSTAIHLLFGAAGLVSAIGAAIGLWTLR